MRINGVPQPERHRKLGGKEIPPRHQRDHGGGGSTGNNGGGGCGLLLFGLLSAPWLADLLLAGSAVTR